MFGLVAALRRDGAPVDAGMAGSLLESLTSHGAEVGSWVTEGSLAVAWTTSEPTPAGQRDAERPVRTADGSLFLFHGRLDNVDEVAAALGRAGTAARDAEIAAQAWERWGAGCASRLIGPFAALAAHPEARRMVCIRDPLGGRPLFFHLTPRLLIVASEERVLCAAPGVDTSLDEVRLAQYFGADVRAGGRTFFRGVREVPPGTVLEVEASTDRCSPFWGAEAMPALSFSGEEECVEAFRELLAAAVRARLRAPAATAVMTSGGIDSTALAALAARVSGTGGGPHAVSWVFDERRECDERPVIAATVSALGLPWHSFAADDLWPLHDPGVYCLSASSPEESCYRGLLQGAYELARGSGCGVVLNGGAADVLYLRQRAWLNSLLRERRWRDLGRDLVGVRAASGWSGLLRAARRAVAEARPSAGRRAAAVAPRWLTPWARGLLASRSSDGPGRAGASGLSTVQTLARLQSRGPGVEGWHARRAGVDLRHPYRDRRLVEFMLGVPAHFLFRPGRPKLLTRAAVRGLVPPDAVAPRPPTILTPLFDAGIDGPARPRVEKLLFGPRAGWRRWVEPDFIRRALTRRGRSEAGRYVLWQCVAFELWRERHGHELG